MSKRPTIAPDVLAAIISSAPERLQKKLDREPRIADEWTWELTDGQWTVTAGEERVSIPSGTITEVVQVKCTCLLSPRCFHVLAVLNVAEIAAPDAEATGESDDSTPIETIPGADSEGAPTTSPQTASVELSSGQVRAARLMFEACAAILNSGLRASGAVLQSRLLRAIHECRSEGLHRLGAGGLRLVTNLRLLRDEDGRFNSAEAENDFRDVLETCVRLTRQSPPIPFDLIGVARRAYQPVNSLKLHGLFCEPILTRSGYAGVVTWLIADDGWIGTSSDVQPGDASRIDQAWRSGVSLAGLSLSHRDLSRKCLLISKATRSVDGRLGGGESARAVTIDGQGWDAPPIARRFLVPLTEQIRRVFTNQVASEFLRPAGTELVFFSATVLGYAGQELIVNVADTDAVLRLAITLDDDKVAFRSSLQMLSRVPGVSLRCIGRVDVNAAGRIHLLAVASGVNDSADLPRLIPPAGSPCVSIGLEEISRSHLSRAESQPVRIEIADSPQAVQANDDACLERWLRAIVIGGRHAIPQGLVTSAVRDAARLKANLRPTAASLLQSLTQATNATRTELTGVRASADPVFLAEKWLAASIGSQVTTSCMQLNQWMSMLEG